MRLAGSAGRTVTVAVMGYTGLVVALWLSVALLSDRAWPVTLIAFGPRWLAALPLVPLVMAVWLATSPPARYRLFGVLAFTTGILVVGFLDWRLGLGRVPGPSLIRLLTHNLGGSQVTAEAVDRLLRAEGVDVAALQECPFYDYGPARLGWQFYYGGDLCLMSRFPFTVLDVAAPGEEWRRGGREPLRVAIQGPTGRFQLMNVHLDTIRVGLDALGTDGWSAVPRFVENRQASRLGSSVARERISGVSEPIVVAGDFNLPVESAIYRRYWGSFENVFSSCGRGFGATKYTWLFGIRIDHVLASAHWDCVDARVIEASYGGDHVPLIVDLRLR
jgi:endonuclease/exonuclease/phosphatase (EEP) superfamily protein YafD